MAIEIGLGALLLALFVVVLIIRFFHEPKLVIYNSVLGLITFLVLNWGLGFGIPINFWTLAIVALGGVGGVFLILIFHFLGIAF